MDNSKPIAIRYADELEAHTVTRSQLSEAVKLADGLSAHIADLGSKIEAKDGEIAKLTAAAVESDAKIVASAESIAALSAEVESLKGKLAMSPAHISVGGQAAVPDHSGDSSASDWPAALKLCNGDYVEARRKFPKQYESFMSRK